MVGFDDDEVAHAGWLKTMTEATRSHPAEVHYGRVLGFFAPLEKKKVWMA